MPRTNPTPTPEGLVLAQVIQAMGWTQLRLAGAVGLHKNTISGYVTGAMRLPRETLLEWSALMGCAAEIVEELLAGARHLLGQGEETPAGSPADLVPERARKLRRIAAAVAREVEGVAYAELARADRQVLIARDRRRAASLAGLLRDLSPQGWQVLVRWQPKFRTWAMCEKLGGLSERAAADSANKALALAEVALEAALGEPGEEHWREPRESVHASCLFIVGNARRVGNDLPAAAEAFAEGRRLWGAVGKGTTTALDEARMLDMEASLHRAQRRFTRALRLHEEALLLSLPARRASILLNKAVTLEQKGDHESAIATLREMEPLLDRDREPRLLFGYLFNFGVNLTHAGRHSEAVPLFLEAQGLAGRLRHSLDGVRVVWLGAKIAAGQGWPGKALADFDRVRQEFMRRKMPYDTALVTLEMAVLLADQGRTREVKVLAEQTAPLFEAQGVDREAVACFLLFQEAAERGALTAELARRVLARLRYPQEVE